MIPGLIESHGHLQELGEKKESLDLQGLDKDEVFKELDKCLLSDDDLLKGKNHWATFTDPFPDEWKETA